MAVKLDVVSVPTKNNVMNYEIIYSLFNLD